MPSILARRHMCYNNPMISFIGEAHMDIVNPHWTKEEVSEWISYNPKTGQLHWNKPPSKSVKPGQPITNITSSGHVQFMLNGRRVAGHRAAWLLTYGEWPKGQIDHINRDPSDNRIENLRLASHSQNVANRARRDGQGVVFCPRSKSRPYRAFIGHDGKRIELGYFETKEEAAAAYLGAAIALKGAYFDSAGDNHAVSQ